MIYKKYIKIFIFSLVVSILVPKVYFIIFSEGVIFEEPVSEQDIANLTINKNNELKEKYSRKASWGEKIWMVMMHLNPIEIYIIVFFLSFTPLSLMVLFSNIDRE